MQSEENGGGKILVTLTRSQWEFLDQEVLSGRALSKQDAIRKLIDKILEPTTAAAEGVFS